MEKGKTKKVFRSRISVLLACILLAVLIPCCIIPMIKYPFSPGFYLVGGILMFVVFIFGGMRYVISGDKLYLKMWIITCGGVKISDIIAMERSYNPLSSPAASLKRLQLVCGKGAKFPIVLISPVREQEFIEELRMVNPNIFVRVPAIRGIWRIWDWDI